MKANSLLTALIAHTFAPRCPACTGTGMVTVHRPLEWSPEVCWCSACGGTGRASQSDQAGAADNSKESKQ